MTHHASSVGTPEPAPHDSAECRDVPADWIYTHNIRCGGCGEYVTDTKLKQHQENERAAKAAAKEPI